MRDDSLIINGTTYVPSKVAALRVRIVSDYATRLARLGLVRGVRHEGAWYIDPDNLDEFMRDRAEHFADIREKMSRARKSDLKRYEIESVLSSEQHTPALTLPPRTLAAFHAKGKRRRIITVRFVAVFVVGGIVLAGSFLVPASARTALVASASAPSLHLSGVSDALRHLLCPFFDTCMLQTAQGSDATDQQTAATAAAVAPPLSYENAAPEIGDSDHAADAAPRTIVTRIVTSMQQQPITVFPSDFTPLSITQSLAQQLAVLTSIVRLQQNPPTFPQQVAGNGVTGPAPGGFVLGPAVGTGSGGSSGSSGSGSVAASSITGTITNAINAASAAITSLTGSDLTYTRAVFTEATTTYLAVTSSASFASLAATGTASLATTTISGDLSVTGTTTTGKLAVSSLDCTSYGNGGKLTTDASGNVTCAADQGGAGSTVGGSTNQVQYNDFGAFGASSAFTFSTTSARLSVTNASTTALSASYASSTDLHAGTATLSSATTSSLAITSITNSLLYANGNGSVIPVATSSLGLPTLSDLNGYLTLSAWYSTTTDQLAEGTTHFYFSTARATTSFIGNLAATTSVNSIVTLNNLSLLASQVSDFATAATQNFVSNLAATTSVASITTLPNLSLPSSQVTGLFAYLFPGNATTTELAFNGGLTASRSTTTNATTSSFAITGVASSVLRTGADGAVAPLTIGSGLSFDGTTLSTSGAGITSLGAANQQQIGGTQTLATSTLVWNGITLGSTIVSAGNTHTFTPTLTGTLDNAGLTNSSLTINGVSISLGGTQTITAASSTLLSDSNIFTGTNTFNGQTNLSYASSTGISSGYASSTNLFAGTLALPNIVSSLLKTDGSGNVTVAVAGTDYATPAQIASSYPFQLTGNATSTLTQFNGGFTAFASSTVGNGSATGGLTISGTATSTNLTVTGVTSALHLADSAGNVTAYSGTSCTNQFVRSINGAGVATCASVNLASDVTGTLAYANGGTGTTTAPQGQLLYGGASSYQSVATSSATIGSSLSYSGTFGALVGGAAGTLSLNMGNANTWTALQTFANASSSLASVYNALYVGTTATTTILGTATSTFGAGIQTTVLDITSSSASSTFANGINLSGGCFAVNGTCVGGSSSSFAYPFTSGTNFGATTNSTTTNLSLFAGLNASTTVRFGNSGVTGQFLWDGTNGRLGLGTSTPWALLSVAGTVAANAIIPNGTYTNNLSAYDLGATGARWNALWAGTVNVGTSTFSLAANSASGLGIYNAASAGGTQVMTITSGGNVGIGTTGPWEALSLPYNSKISLGASTLYNFNIYKASAGNLVTYFDSRDDVLASSVQFRMRTGGTPVDTMTLTGAGNVGIGTTSPVKKLSVYNPSDSYVATFKGAYTGAVGVGTYSTNYGFIQGLSNEQVVATSNLLLNPDGGNVGIGTSGASYKLDVAGDVNVSSGSCFRVNGVCIGYTVKLAAVYATSTAGTTTVQFTGAQDSAPSFSAGSPGTLTLQSNASSIVAEVWGGGGGGVSAGSCNPGQGGGAGGYALKNYTSLATKYYFNVSRGGANAGKSGSYTSFGTGSATTTGNGGTTAGGGTASGGDINVTGGSGMPADAGVCGAVGGSGGSAYRGGIGGVSGVAGGNFGGGGGGAADTGTSAAGGAGGVVITIYATSSPTAAGNDYAEMFPVSSPGITAGDIVSVDGGMPVSMKLAEKGDRALAGVVATNPGQILGDQNAAGMRPIALAGRVPVKFSNVNGDVQIGDRIAPSSIPGVGIKAGPFDDSVGIVIDTPTTDENGNTTVMIFLDLHKGIDINALGFALLTNGATTSVATSTGPLDFVGGVMQAIGNRIAALPANEFTYTASSSTATSTDTATTTAATSTDAFASGLMHGIVAKLREWFADAANGIGDFFANRVHTKELCVSKADGSEVCVTGDQLASVMASVGNAPGSDSPGGNPSTGPGSDSPSGTGSATSTTGATIVLDGNDPQTWQLGTAWSDNLGALFTHGGASETIYSTSTVDTSLAGTTTIDYWATWYPDPTASSTETLHATRDVVVYDPNPVVATSSPETNSTTPDGTI